MYDIIKRVTRRRRRSERPSRQRVAVFFAVIIIVVYAFLIVLSAKNVFAIGNPDSINIDAVKAYDSVLEADDLLVVVEYNLPYSSLPDEIITDAFLGRFKRSTTELNTVEPFAFNDKGYGKGVFSFYWTAAQKSTDSIEFDNPNEEDYTVTLQGDIGVFTGSVPTTTTDTIGFRDSTDTKNLLLADVKAIALVLENDTAWEADRGSVITTGGGTAQFTTTGEDYFSNAIPNLDLMIPSIFSSGVTTPDFTERTPNRSFEETLDTFWDGNWVDTRFQNLATRLEVPKRTLTTLFALFFMGLITWFVAKLLGGDEKAIAFGLLTNAVTLPMAAGVNWIPINLAITVGFICLLGIGFALFLRRAGS